MVLITDTIKQIFVLGRFTILEVVRERFALILLLLVVVMSVLSLLAGSLSMGEERRIMVDSGLALSNLVSRVLAILLTVAILCSELRRDSVQVLLLRSPPRWAYVLGRFLGIWCAVGIAMLMMISVTVVAIKLLGESVPRAFWSCVWLNIVEIAVVVAIVLFFSVQLPKIIAGMSSAVIVFAGSFVDDFQNLANRAAQNGEVLYSYVGNLIYYGLPDLMALSLRHQVATAVDVSAQQVVDATLYGLSYAVTALVASMWIFSSRKSI